MQVLPIEFLPDAMKLYERARSHGPHIEDFFSHEEFVRIAKVLRDTNPTIDNYQILAFIFREAARHLKGGT